MAFPPQFQKVSKGKVPKKAPPFGKPKDPKAKVTKGKLPVQGASKGPPFGKPPAAPGAGSKAPIDPATLGSMTNSLKNVGK